jgi:hypothetical protein
MCSSHSSTQGQAMHAQGKCIGFVLTAFFFSANDMPPMLSPNGRVDAHTRTSRAFRPATLLAIPKEMPSRMVYPERRPLAHTGAARAIVKATSLAHRPDTKDTGREDGAVEDTWAADCVARQGAVTFHVLVLVMPVGVGDACPPRRGWHRSRGHCFGGRRCGLRLVRLLSSITRSRLRLRCGGRRCGLRLVRLLPSFTRSRLHLRCRRLHVRGTDVVSLKFSRGTGPRH